MNVIARDPDLNRVGALPITDGTAVVRHHGLSTCVFTLDAKHPAAQLLHAGGGVIVENDDGVLMSGPTRVFEHKAAADEPLEDLTLEVLDDALPLAGRLVYPNPALAATAQDLAYDVRTGAAETVMKQLVNLNAGPGALSAREVPGLTLATDLARGGTVSSSARFDSLFDKLVELGRAGGLGFRVVQVGLSLEFDVYETVDLSTSVRFFRELGNLRDYKYRLSAPTATTVLVLGQGEGAAREIVERTDTAAETLWGRWETTQDRRDTTDIPTLQQAGDQALAEKGATASLEVNPLDVPLMRYGQNYRVGDTVTVELGDGAFITDIVSQVTFKTGSEGTTVTPTVGPPEPGALRIYQRQAEQQHRLNFLERSL